MSNQLSTPLSKMTRRYVYVNPDLFKQYSGKIRDSVALNGGNPAEVSDDMILTALVDSSMQDIEAVWTPSKN